MEDPEALFRIVWVLCDVVEAGEGSTTCAVRWAGLHGRPDPLDSPAFDAVHSHPAFQEILADDEPATAGAEHLPRRRRQRLLGADPAVRD